MITVPNLNAGRYACPVCAKRFAALADKKNHVRTEHGKQGKKVRS